MTVLIVLLSLVGLYLVAALATGFYVTQFLYHPRHFDEAQGIQHERELGSWTEGEFSAEKKTYFEIEGVGGVKLHACWVSAKRPTKKAVVIMHGFGCCLVNSYKYAKLFLPLGFDVLLFDNRNAGESEGKRTTLGYLEAQDLQKAVDAAFLRVGADGIVGLHGESLGGASVVMEASRDPRISFAVADCPFMDMAKQVRHSIRFVAKLPAAPIFWAAALINRLRAKFRFCEVSPLRELTAADGLAGMPLLLIHGTADGFILPQNSEQLYAAKTGYRRKWLCEGAAHARSIVTDPEGYRRTVEEFLRENGMLD